MKSRRAVTVLAVVLLLAAGVAAALYLTNRRDVTTSSDEAYGAYRKAIENERRFYFKEAKLGFAKALELDPDFAMAMVGLARHSDREKGHSLTKRASQLRSRLNEREQLHLDLQLAYWDKGHQEAVRIAREIRKRYPEDIRAASILANDEVSRGNTERGIQIFQELLAIDPNIADAYNQIGYFEAYRGNYEKAVEAFQKYQFMAPDQANPHDSLGEVQAFSGRYDEAIANLNKALAVKPDFFVAHAHLGVAYEGKGDYPRAIQHYRRAAELAVSDDVRRGCLFQALRVVFVSGDREAAASLYALIEQLPKDEYAGLRKVMVQAGRELFEGRPAQTERLLEGIQQELHAALAKNVKTPGYQPYDAGFTYLLALAKAEQGKEDEAILLYERMTKPPNPWHGFEERRWVYEARAALAALLAKKGDLDRAEKLLAENHKWNPSWAPTRKAELTVARLRRERVMAAAK